ncbi:metal-sulfur cluster assembly factor [Kineococcus sp. SYSU DK018]|uniref:metal-sulfur cluster assembly factor n=1 Tax=Kineococcus sp. SYSU DK018 TaxID=3383139 RepID=UPI003D7D6026
MTATSERPVVVTRADVTTALGAVVDPELDEPITDLGFVRSVEVGADGDVVVHLRLPTSFCSPNFAYLMASDAKDVIAALPGVGRVVVELDDHHDSELINAGLASGAGYRGTFRHEALDSLDELRATFRRKAHTAAAERCLTALLRSRPGMVEEDLGAVVLDDLPDDDATRALRRRRADLGVPVEAPVLLDEGFRPVPRVHVPLRLRRARSVRISVDGNAHFCRGLLRTRYPGSGADQSPRPADTGPVPVQLLTRRPDENQEMTA